MMSRPGVESRRSVAGLVALQAALVLLILAIAGTTQLETLPPQDLIYPLSALVLVMFVWQVWSWRLATGHWFDPYSIFLIDAMLFNTGQALLNVFNLNP